MNTRAQLTIERAASADTAAQLRTLESMTVGELAAQYRELMGVPTRTRNKDYLRKRLAWRIQELSSGGLSPRALARIEQLAPLAPVRWQEPLKPVPRPAPNRPRDPRLPTPGTVLTRLHGGVEHKVTVLDDGFEYQGERHRSLSKIARLITGTPWNGFGFFLGRGAALKKAEDEAAA